MAAKYELDRVRQITNQGNTEGHFFSNNKAILPVVQNLRLSRQGAEEFIFREISKLEEINFCSSIFFEGFVYDIYGKRIEGIPWYIKFSISEENRCSYIYTISFHPPKRELRTNSEILEEFQKEE